MASGVKMTPPGKRKARSIGAPRDRTSNERPLLPLGLAAGVSTAGGIADGGLADSARLPDAWPAGPPERRFLSTEEAAEAGLSRRSGAGVFHSPIAHAALTLPLARHDPAPGGLSQVVAALAAVSSVASHLGWIYGTGKLAVELPEIAKTVAEDAALNARVVLDAAASSAVSGLDTLGMMSKGLLLLLFVWAVVFLFTRRGWSRYMHIVYGNTPPPAATSEAETARALAADAKAVAAKAAAEGARHADAVSSALRQRTRRGADLVPSFTASAGRMPSAGSGLGVLDTLEQGMRVRFRYARGARRDELRTVIFQRVVVTSGGSYLEVLDLDKKVTRQYCPDHMSDITVMKDGATVAPMSRGDGGAAASAAQPEPWNARGSMRPPAALSGLCFPRLRSRLEPTPKAIAAAQRTVRKQDMCAQTEDPPEVAEAASVPIRFLTGSSMRVALEAGLRGAEESVRAALYCYDDSELTRILSQKAQRGVLVQLIFDDSQVRNPSCSHQIARMIELQEWGAELFRLRVGSGYTILHHKLWVVDGTTLFSGSVNPTYNGLTNNEENLLEITEPKAVTDALAHLESLRERAELITREFLSEHAQIFESRRRSRSTSVRRR